MRTAAAIVTACLIVGIVAVRAESAAPTRNQGYWIAGANSQVFAFGDAQLYARGDRRAIRGQVADVAAHPSGKGYWLLGRDGAVYPYGEARDLGQATAREQDAVAIGATPSGDGYFVATVAGQVRAFGDAVARGSLGRRGDDDERSIVDMAVTPSGAGYWLVDAAGQVYAFGDASARGSLPRHGDDEDEAGGRGDARSDVVAIGGTPTAGGYWLATAGGDVFAFGDAPALGSLAVTGRRSEGDEEDGRGRKIVDLTTTHTGRGFWLVDRDGLVFAFGDALRYGELARRDLRSGLVTAIVSTPFVNHDPVAAPDAVELDEDTTLDVNVLANDTDEDGDPLAAVVLTQPAHGTAVRNADGTIRYTPAPDYNGRDSFTYEVTDGFGGSATGTVTIVVRPVNDAPVARDDAFTVDEDTVLTGSLTANDTDVDLDVLTAQLVTGPAHGTIVLGSDGSFTYTPDPNFFGDDTFTYRAFDGSLASEVATVRIHVNPVNDAPVANPDNAWVDEDTVLAVPPPGVLGNDTDVEGSPLTATLVTGPAHGTLTLSAAGGYTYLAAADYHGPDDFTYRASDGALDSGVVTAAITVRPVNDLPVAMPETYAATEDVALVVAGPGVLANDTDVDGDPLAAQFVTGPAHGALALLVDGGFTYTPTANFNGPDSFTYVARDAVAASNTVTVTIQIAAVNDAPVAVDDAYSLVEDGSLTIAAPGVLANDADVESATLTATLVTGPAHGVVIFASDGSFTYTPLPDYAGADSFTYTATDGLRSSAPATVALTVAGLNDAPAAAPDTYTIDEDTALVVGVPGVLANDGDDDGDTLLVFRGEQPQHGSVTLLVDGSFEYVPDANYHGSDGFTYDVTDGTETVFGIAVTITVTAVADPPSAEADSYSVQAGSTLTVGEPGVLANDFVEGGTLTAILVSGPAQGTLALNANGSFTYTTTLTTAGSDSFAYKANDGTTDSAPATVTITITAGSGGGGGGGSGSFGGWSTGVLTVWDFDALKIGGGSGTLRTKLGTVVGRSDGTFYVPDRGARGRDSFTYGSVHYEIDVLSDIWGD